MTLLTVLPLLGAILVALAPDTPSGRRVTLGSLAGILAVAIFLAMNYDRAAGGLQFAERHAWVPMLGIEYFVAADGLSLLMVLLTALITPFAVLVAGPRFGRLEMVCVLLLQTTLFGTFTAFNFIHWFLFYELSLVPAFLLVRHTGGAAATRAALGFFIYTMAGGLLILLAFVAMFLVTGSFDIPQLAARAGVGDLDARLGTQWGPAAATLVFFGVFAGLAVKVPVVPFHTWLPDTYSEAPTPVTMLLTGLMSKMGVYGLLRLWLPLFPESIRQFAPLLFALALVTVLYPAFVALRQTNLKRLLAYSSVNHLGYCVLGIVAAGAALDPAARETVLTGVALQMFNHGLTAAALFGFVAILENRSGGLHGLEDFGGLRTAAPVLAGLMGIALFSSLGLPGLNGFAGEFLIFKGTFAIAAWAAAVAAIGLLVTAVLLLNVIQKVFTGPLPARWNSFGDLRAGEIALFAPAIVLLFVLGVWPQLLIALVS